MPRFLAGAAVIILYNLLIISYWFFALLESFFFAERKRYFRHPSAIADIEVTETDDSAKPNFFRRRKKPQWVIDKVIYLKAVNHLLGCRKIAELFDRLHAEKYNMTVSKSYVYYTLRKHQYEVQVLRRMIKHRRPIQLKRNICWGVDLTTITDNQGDLLPVFVTVDYGSRRCIAINSLKSKHSLVLLCHLFRAVMKCGKPRAIKTDNEAVFIS